MFWWVSHTHSAKLPIRQLLRLLLSATLAAVVAYGGIVLIPGFTGYVFAALLFGVLLSLISLVTRCWTKSDFTFALRHLQQRNWFTVRMKSMLAIFEARFGAS